MPEISVVLPCYNEGKNIPVILKRFSSLPLDFELILVNNGSLDNTAEVMEKELPKYKFARSVTVKKNIGYGFGILTGLKAAKGHYLSYSHADMQCDPYDIYNGWRMLLSSQCPEKILVKGNRKGRKNLFTSCFHGTATVLFFHKFDDVNGQPKIFHRSLLKSMKKPPYGFSFDFYVQYMALRSDFGVISFPVKFRKRLHGKSSWASNFRSRLKTILGMTGYLLKLRFFGG